MHTIILYTALMVGITILIGFVVSALIKIVGDLLTFTEDHTLKEFITMLRAHSISELIRGDLRAKILSKSKESDYEMFEYAHSYNPSGKNARKSSGIFDYAVSHNSNPKKEKKEYFEIFDYSVSHNKK